MKREVMLTAWKMYRKGFGSFPESLKRAWALVKKLYKFTKKTSITQEKADSLMKNNRAFRHSANHSNNSTNIIYHGKREVTYEYNFWMNYGKTRFYCTEFVDGIRIETWYVE